MVSVSDFMSWLVLYAKLDVINCNLSQFISKNVIFVNDTKLMHIIYQNEACEETSHFIPVLGPSDN